MELRAIRGIGAAYDERLRAAGIADAEDLAWVDDLSSLADRTGIPPARLADFRAQAIRLAADRHRPPRIALRSATARMLSFARSVVWPPRSRGPLREP